MQAIIARIIAWFGCAAIQKVIKSIPAIVAEVEKAMQDGKITADERKDIAMATVDSVVEQFGVKITGIVRWAISMLIDTISKKLPAKDIVVSNVITKIVSQPD